MSENAEVVEVVEDADTGAETVEGTEGGEAVEQKEKPFAAWDLPKPEPKIPAHIPYDRFKQVNEERAQFFEDNRAMAARIKELESAQEKASRVPDPDEIDIKDFDNPQDYLRARDKAVAAKIRADIQADTAAREQEQIQARQVQEISHRYITNLQTHAAENPDVMRAKEFFDAYADNINPGVGRELLSDPNVGHVMVRIATDKNLLQQFFQGDETDAKRLINRVSARIDAERELTPKQIAEGGEEAAPQRRTGPAPMRGSVDPRQAILSSLPVRVAPTPARQRLDLYKDADKMTMAQYRKARSGK
jgi:hypothetical protein